MNNRNQRVEILDTLKSVLQGYINLGIIEVEHGARSSNKTLLHELKNEVLQCRKCPLYKGKKNYVFGEGAADASLMFVGEAPGYYEDIAGKPFVGKAGKLLTKIIEAMGLKREDVYIGNILKCRPPENRNPQEDEIETCFPYLDRQIEIIKPKVICALGKFAAQTLVKTNISISNLRGELFYYKGIKVVPTFHPSYLLRNPKGKRKTWEDMKLILKIIGREVKNNE